MWQLDLNLSMKFTGMSVVKSKVNSFPELEKVTAVVKIEKIHCIVQD